MIYTSQTCPSMHRALVSFVFKRRFTWTEVRRKIRGPSIGLIE